jgi:1-acyl-sn-glycerol-3-phosphate acyltransferase
LIIFFAIHIRFEEDITRFIPKGKEVTEVNEVFKNLNLKDRLIIEVSQASTVNEPDPARLINFADTFVQRLNSHYKSYISKTFYTVSDESVSGVYNYIINHLPVFLEEKDYLKIDSLFRDGAIETTMDRNYLNLISPAGFAFKQYIYSDPLHIGTIALSRLKSLQITQNYEIISNHIFSKDQKHLLIFINPAHPASETSKNGELIDGMDELIAQLYKVGPSISVTYFGSPAVSVCNARQIKADTMLTLSIAILVIVLFISFAFRKKFISIAIIIPVIFGIAFSLAIMYLIKGQISAMAIGAGSVVFGIGLSYSLHLFNHFKHTQSVPDVIKDLTNPMTIGSFTTIAAFLSLAFVSSEALQDFGILSALSLLGTILFCLIVMPHFLKPSKDDEHNHQDFGLSRWIDKISSYRFESNYWIILLVAVVSVVFWFTSKNTGFDSDMMNLNYTTDKLKRAEAALNNILGESIAKPVYLVTTGTTLDKALNNQVYIEKRLDSLKQAGLINQYATPRCILISEDEQKVRIARWQSYWTPARKDFLRKNLINKSLKQGYKATTFDSFLSLLDKPYQPVNMLNDDKLRSMLLGDWVNTSSARVMVISLATIRPQDKELVYSKLANVNNTVIFDKQYFAKKFVNILNQDFYFVLYTCSLLVFITMLLSYGRFELTIMTFLPMAISWLWILGIMGLFNIKFNIINIIISSFIFGLGDDFSIFIQDGLLQEYRTGKSLLASHKSAIFLSAFTTLVGVGVLIFAKHPALRSIATISIIGMLSVVLISYTVQPLLFKIFVTGRTRKKKFPFTFKSFFLTIFAFTYFVSGCFTLSSIGITIFWGLPLSKRKKKLIYHWVLQKFPKSLVYIMFNTKKNIINTGHEDFSKPAIIISNHQSFLDILVMLMLNPRSIMVTNKWVWNSPFFGRVVKLGGFFPVEKGVENGIDYFRERLKEGFSIIIFPEGSRQADCEIKRFHKGAFYLAEQLQADIVPVIIQGNGDAMTKGDDFYLKNSYLSLKILKRITPDDKTFGDTYRERAKQVKDYFREQYDIFKIECSNRSNPYFRYKLIKNFTYKGPILEWYLRVKLWMEKDYEQFHQLIPLKASIVDIGCGYGFMSYMLGFMSEHRVITGIDYDEEKIDIANHCFSKDERYHFICSDAATFPVPLSDVFIISDMLHYLPYEKQQQLILRCIDNLNPKGMLIIRDADSSMPEKHRVTRFTEVLSTRLFGFNKVTGKLEFTSKEKILNIVSGHNMNVNIINNDKHTSNVIYVLTKKD